MGEEITLRAVMQLLYNVICYTKQQMELTFGFGRKKKDDHALPK